MKIDLHCHTKRIKSGDGSGRNVTKELFCKKIFDADVKIVAITNHNAFDKEQFFEFKDHKGPHKNDIHLYSAAKAEVRPDSTEDNARPDRPCRNSSLKQGCPRFRCCKF